MSGTVSISKARTGVIDAQGRTTIARGKGMGERVPSLD